MDIACWPRLVRSFAKARETFWRVFNARFAMAGLFFAWVSTNPSSDVNDIRSVKRLEASALMG